jgi:serine/threonine protein kinase
LRLKKVSYIITKNVGPRTEEVAKFRYESEFAKSSTRFYMDKHQYLPEPEKNLLYDEALHACAGAMTGLKMIHARGFVHLDIKPDNLLVVDHEGKISDFGIALDPEKRAFDPTGSPGYLPPEFFSVPRPEKFAFSMDAFSAGMMLLALQAANIAMVSNPALATVYTQATLDAQEQLQALALQDPIKGPVYRLIAKMIDINPAKRPPIGEAEGLLKSLDHWTPPT